MTRETKIGLLVGLAFIIVIGILLSDHLTSATEPPAAQLTQVGNNVRSTTAAPGAQRTPSPIFGNDQSPVAVAPQNVVPTQTELSNRTPPVQIINVGGPAQNQAPPISMAPPVDQNNNQPPVTLAHTQQEQAAAPQDGSPVVDQAPLRQPEVVPTTLQQLAQQHGEELLGPELPANSNRQANASGMTSYVAQSGDSVSRLAAKFLGGNTRANRDLIINANPSLKQDANKIIIGRTYMIPAPSNKPQPVQSTASTPTQPAVGENWYTVQSGDSLWKIAENQCGSSMAIAAIKELNKDTIKGEIVMAGQKIRLPNKAVN